jgi:Zn-dependent protease with chaperone function
MTDETFISRIPRVDLRVDPWPTERPLFVANVVLALLLWLVAIFSVVGIVYGIGIGLFLFVAHLGFVAHLRGSGLRVTPEQLPEIHGAVARLASRFGMPAPETYVVHGSGALNAFATRFVGCDIVVLHAELLDACEGNDRARDMIIAHELGHVHRRHLRWHFFLLPTMMVPFIGSALSRAREYTCDRYGLAGAGDRDAALFGLTVLAAGGRLAHRVDRRAFAAQRAQLNTGWMTLGEWFASHPPLAKRLLQIDPTLAVDTSDRRAILRAAVIVGAVLLPMMFTGIASLWVIPRFSSGAWLTRGNHPAPPSRADAERIVRQDFQRMGAFIEAEVQAGRALPWDEDELYQRWRAAHPGEPEPLDPYDGMWYGYEQKGEHFRLWSSGSANDGGGVRYDSRTRSTSQH